jgi:hypothetical protein
MHIAPPLLVLGADSGLFCLAMGPLALSHNDRIRLALAFGICDAAASVFGLRLQYSTLPRLPEFWLYLGCAVVLGLAARRNRSFLYGVPVLLSLDNLTTGLPIGPAIAAGICSSTLAAIGLFAGAVGQWAARAACRGPSRAGADVAIIGVAHLSRSQ